MISGKCVAYRNNGANCRQKQVNPANNRCQYHQADKFAPATTQDLVPPTLIATQDLVPPTLIARGRPASPESTERKCRVRSTTPVATGLKNKIDRTCGICKRIKMSSPLRNVCDGCDRRVCMTCFDDMDSIYDSLFDLTGDSNGEHQFEPNSKCRFKKLCDTCQLDDKIMMEVMEGNQEAFDRYIDAK